MGLAGVHGKPEAERDFAQSAEEGQSICPHGSIGSWDVL